MVKNIDKIEEKKQQILRGLRIKEIRENELHLTKSDLANKLKISSQFLGLIESGKGNLTFRSLKLLRDLSGHSADYIIYGLDDKIKDKTKKYLEFFNEKDLINGLDILKDLFYLIKHS